MSYFCAVSQRMIVLSRRVGEREDNPAWIGAGRLGRNGHAPDDAVGARRGFDAQLVAAALVEFAKKGDVDLLVGGADDDRLNRKRLAVEARQRQKQDGEQPPGLRKGALPGDASAPPGSFHLAASHP